MARDPPRASRTLQTDEDESSDQPAPHTALERPPTLRIEDPYGVISNCSTPDLHELSQWYFTSHVDDSQVNTTSSTSWITLSSKAWGQHFWDVASQSEVCFAFLVLMVVHKQTVLSGRPRYAKDFFLTQDRLIRLLQQNISDMNPDSALAICAMALFSLRQGDNATARAHMSAVQALSRVRRLEDSPCWVSCSWMDLLIATAFDWEPYLPYRLPSSERLTSASPQRLEEARRNSLKAIKSMAFLGPGFGHHQAFECLLKLNEACFVAEDRNTITHPPSNLLYDVAFQLCHLSTAAVTRPHLRLLVVAMQLCWLSAAKFWLPHASPLWPSLLVRLDATLQACPSIVARWQEEGCLLALLWVSLVGHQNARQSFPGLALRLVAIARCTRELLGITRLQELKRHMASFPGIPTDKDAAVKNLWETIKPSASTKWVAVRDEGIMEQGPTCTDASQSKKFVTIFQFETLDNSSMSSCSRWLKNRGQNVEL